MDAGRQVDHQVAAGEQVEARERRVGEQAVRREDHHLADLLADQQAVAVRAEEALHALRPQRRRAARRVAAAPGVVDRLLVEVGGEDLQGPGRRGGGGPDHLAEGHGQGVGLLAGGAARHPGAQRAAGGLAREQRRQDVGAQLIPHLLVAEEARHPDQQLAEQQLDLGGVGAQQLHVRRPPGEVEEGGAPLDAAQQRGLLVGREVVAGVAAQHLQDGGEHPVAAARGVGARVAAERGDDERGQRVRGRDQHGVTGGDGVGRHAGGAGAGGRLRGGHATALQYRLQPARAVLTGPGQDHADRVGGLVPRQRGEEGVDGVQVARAERPVQPQDAGGDGQVAVGRYHVGVVRRHAQAIGDLHHRHAGDAREKRDQQAGVRRIEVLDHHECQAAARRHVGEEGAERLEPAGRGAQADHRDAAARDAFARGAGHAGAPGAVAREPPIRMVSRIGFHAGSACGDQIGRAQRKSNFRPRSRLRRSPHPPRMNAAQMRRSTHTRNSASTGTASMRGLAKPSPLATRRW